VLVKDTLYYGMLRLISKVSSVQDAARMMVGAYGVYAKEGRANGEVPIFTGAEHKRMTDVLVRTWSVVKGGTPEKAAEGFAEAVRVFWMGPPVVEFSVGEVIAVEGVTGLKRELTKLYKSQNTASIAVLKKAANVHVASQTVKVRVGLLTYYLE
jgi:hypothetical protein